MPPDHAPGGKDAAGLPPGARGAIAVGVALAALVGAGLVINLVTRITIVSWAVAVGVLAAAAAVAFAVPRIWRRRAGGAAGGSPAGQPRKRGAGWTWKPAHVPSLGVRSALPAAGYLLLALGLAAGAVVLAARSAGWRQTPGFAQLWLVPGNGTAVLGVRNHYPGTETFRLELRRGAVPVADWQLRLAAGQTWRSSVVAPAGSPLSALLATPNRVLTVAVTP